MIKDRARLRALSDRAVQVRKDKQQIQMQAEAINETDKKLNEDFAAFLKDEGVAEPFNAMELLLHASEPA